MKIEAYQKKKKKNTRGNMKAELTQSLSVKIIAVQHVLEYSSQCNEIEKNKGNT